MCAPFVHSGIDRSRATQTMNIMFCMYTLDEIRRLVSLEQAGRVVVSPWQRETHVASRPIEGEGALVFGHSYWVDTARGRIRLRAT